MIYCIFFLTSFIKPLHIRKICFFIFLTIFVNNLKTEFILYRLIYI